MADFIIKPGRIEVPSFHLFFERVAHHGSGYSFECSEAGIVDGPSLNPDAAEKLKRCLLGGSKDDPLHPGVVQDTSHSYWESGSIRCDCGAEHYLSRGDSSCDSCGQYYNAGGQRLNPPHMWDDIDHQP